MVKKMPLPPTEGEAAQEAPAATQARSFMPGFAGVVSKIPQGVRKPLSFTDEPPVESEASSATSVVPAIPPASSEALEIEVPVDLIDVSPYQPRKDIDEDALNRLADSMIDGQINAIVVRQLPNGRYELIAGERRWRATILLGRATIRAVVKLMSDSEAEIVAVTDNDAREDLTDYDRACAYKRLLDKGVIGSQSELARRTGKERTFIVRCMSFFRLPPDALRFMEARRNLMGASNAGSFATLAEGNNGADADIVVEAIRKVFDGKMDVTNALVWAKSAIRHRHNPVPTKKVLAWESEGRRLGEVKVSGNQLVITCAEGVSPDELLDKLLKDRLNP